MNTFRLRSFVCRNGRITRGQAQAYDMLWPQYGLANDKQVDSWAHVFGRDTAPYLEIGFGSGQSLLALAKARPDLDFVGIETHKPGIGALLLGVQQAALANIRVYHGDVVDVLTHCIPDASLAGAQIFFPDPWPKRKHHPRRLIQPAFIHQLSAKLQADAQLYLATDWEDYAKHMMRVLSANAALINQAGCEQFSSRSPHRPITTKFERRAEREGRAIWDLAFLLDKRVPLP